jgi:hypothetical protein
MEASPGKSLKRPISTYKKLGAVLSASHHSYSRKLKKKGHGPGINVRPYLKNNQSKTGQRHGLVEDCLPSKHRALSSTPVLPKKKSALIINI